MKSKSEVVGVGLTALYLLLVAGMVYWKWDTLPQLGLNELGDFLAGVFGPVAFLWLILGYLQQGRELRLSSEALQLQATELKNSVEQQTIMAQAAIEQIESQRAALVIKQKEIEVSISPVFRFQNGARSGAGVGQQLKTSLQIFNDGGEVRDVSVSFNPFIGGVDEEIVGKIKSGGACLPIRFEYIWPMENVSGICTISYLRADGKRIDEVFSYEISTASPFVSIDKIFPVLSDYVS